MSFCLQNNKKQFVHLLCWALFSVSVSANQAAQPLSEPDSSLLPDGSEKLRILYHRKFQDKFGIDEQEKRLVEEFADSNNLKPDWIEVEENWQLLPTLFSGKGDLIVSESYDVSGGTQGYLSFTDAWAENKQQVVSRNSNRLIRSMQELAVRQVSVKQSSPVWNQIQALSEKSPLMDVNILDESLSEETILSRVSSGEYDVAVLDSDFVKDNISHFSNLNASFNLSAEERKVWAVSKKNDVLKKALNEFLNKQHLSLNNSIINLRDLAEIKKQGSIRVITYQSPSNVYNKNGRFEGFEYELIKAFADKYALQLDVVFANSEAEMYSLLSQGKGDVIAAFVPEDSRDQENTIESHAYYYSAPVVIGRKSDHRKPIDVRDLEGRSIVLSAESPYLDLLKDLKEKYQLNFHIKQVDTEVNTEALLFMVSMGMYDLTVLPSHQIKSELSRQMNLSAQLHLAEPEKNVWLVRSESTQLQTALNNYIDTIYRKSEFNTLRKKYITNPKTVEGDSRLLTRVTELTPYDSLIRVAADRYNFDWRLIAAQMYQESQFDPQAISSAGAEGLMQLMPGTAVDLGVNEPKNPVESIDAGVRYMKQLRDKFEKDLLLDEKTWFSLAAYNAGYKRVKHARRIADKMGLNPDVWFGNVELAMHKMSAMKNEGDKLACNCGEAIAYVREIKTRYNNYVSLTKAAEVAVQSPRSKENRFIDSL